MRSSCKDCPKKDRCRRICPDIKKLLPPLDGRPRAEFNHRDRSIAWAIQEIEHLLPSRQRRAAHLYFRLGKSEKEVAADMGILHQTVSEYLEVVVKKILFVGYLLDSSGHKR